MPVQVSGRIINKKTVVLDRPLKTDEKEILVKLKRGPIVKTKIDAPEDLVLEIADKDLEELI
ncbi:hypothetical protein [Candidatus Pyrohabitans sp.]